MTQRLRFSTFLTVLLIAGNVQAEIAIDGFEPSATPEADIINITSSNVSPHLVPTLSLFTQFVDDALIYRVDDGPYVRAVDDQFKFQLAAALGLWDWVDLSLAVPVTPYQTGDDRSPITNEPPVDGLAFADPQIALKTKLFDRFHGFGAALKLTGYVPLGDTKSYHSDGAVRFEPQLAIDFDAKSVLIAANLGYQIRPKRQLFNIGSDDALRFGAGVGIPIVDQLDILGSVSGGVALTDGFDPNNLEVEAPNEFNRPFEWNAAIRIKLPANLTLITGGGAGLTSGIGSPDFRVYAGLSHRALSKAASSGESSASDEGVDDDPDFDGVLGSLDRCPNDPEDPDTFEDGDGCPDPDNDGDSILDFQDRCPNQSGKIEKQGCPFSDLDGDSIDDELDVCPEKPEDFDKFEDDDGCPDLDNDGDGIADKEDQCPLKKEVINGVEDEDGCPDSGVSKVRVTADEIQILETVYFDTSKATIKKRSFDLLNQVASILKANPQIQKIRVEGHTDSRGDRTKNLKLSTDRANSVKTYLLERGIEADRLESKGYGELRPVADNAKKEGRSLNRRVEFLIVDVAE